MRNLSSPQFDNSNSVQLETENRRLREQLDAALRYNDAMWKSVVEQAIR